MPSPETDESEPFLAANFLETPIPLEEATPEPRRNTFTARSYNKSATRSRSPLVAATAPLGSLGCCAARYLRRQIRCSIPRQLIVLLKLYLLSVAILLFSVLVIFPSHTSPPSQYQNLEQRCGGPLPEAGCANLHQEKIFIVASMYDKDGELLGGQWGQQLLDLVHIIGPENAFVSIYENNNAPAGTAALINFRRRLLCKSELAHEQQLDLSKFPNITMPDGSERMKRLSYLTELRNRAMWPLDRFDESVGVFDKVLYLNDVFYRPIDAAHLLFSTNTDDSGRTHYLSACAMDFDSPGIFYDSYALRDAEGYGTGSQEYPIFTTAGNAISRHDMLGETDAVRVSTCWSGMVAMQARWVQNTDSALLPAPNFQDVGAHIIDPDAPKSVEVPIRFRYEPEIFADSCECCLFLADVTTVARNAGAIDTDTFLNPYVRVTYKPRLLPWILISKRWERIWIPLQLLRTWLQGRPEVNPHRTVQEGEAFIEEVWVNNRSLSAGGSWVMRERTGRNGMLCWGRMMHLMKLGGKRGGDRNWERAGIPKGHVQ
ncbi:Mannosyltransferase 1, CMT1 [Cordyceps fumosorosea ARSEF 2679]|uniref:Mannosyltransferase 1, CMT1 n=1 Tax=Cordyceps fumosorosea (strain ARSEF 2679) TaxID=1081104 RepID=A0A167ZDU2_CORFA|nr:Mannosyltransferase 1, CMT1 [Cordyceps fumosorosea ARSEF 2679]OAA67387.1 Mannosyltransferase 1, CMT1 [Cordyceps fumosorosea ARSEF 2679]